MGNDSRFSLHGALDSGDDLGNFQDVRAKRAIALGENRALRAIGLRKIKYNVGMKSKFNRGV